MTRRLQIAKLYGDAGLYSAGTELLNGALLEAGDDEVLLSDVLLGLSKVRSLDSLHTHSLPPGTNLNHKSSNAGIVESATGA